MEPSGASNAAPSAGDLVLQQRTQAVQQAQQSAQKGDGSLISQLTSNPFFTAVCDPLHAIADWQMNPMYLRTLAARDSAWQV